MYSENKMTFGQSLAFFCIIIFCIIIFCHITVKPEHTGCVCYMRFIVCVCICSPSTDM